MNEIIADEKDINNEMFLNYFTYQNPLFLVNDLISVKQDKSEKLVNHINNGLNDLRNSRLLENKFLKMKIPKM